MRGYRENSDGEIVKNVSKPSGEFNVCMSGDDGRYGWVDYQGTDPPAVIAISLRGPAFHKTCAGIVDEMLG